MRRMMMIVAMLVLATPSFAAQTFQVPFTVVPGSVHFASNVVSLPLSTTVTTNPLDTNCGGGIATFTVEALNGGVEVGLDGFVSSNNNLCSLSGLITFDLQIDPARKSGLIGGS